MRKLVIGFIIQIGLMSSVFAQIEEERFLEFEQSIEDIQVIKEQKILPRNGISDKKFLEQLWEEQLLEAIKNRLIVKGEEIYNSLEGFPVSDIPERLEKLSRFELLSLLSWLRQSDMENSSLKAMVRAEEKRRRVLLSRPSPLLPKRVLEANRLRFLPKKPEDLYYKSFSAESK